jgi:enoyl-CoA hydratase/carnithine racemase
VTTGRSTSGLEFLSPTGLVDELTDGDAYDGAIQLAHEYAHGPALALRAAKRAIDRALGPDLAAGLELERLPFAALFATADQKAGMRSFITDGPGQAQFVGG